MPVAALSVPEDTGSRPVNRDLLADLRQQVARLERGGRVTEGAVGFGLPEIDDVLPGGGLLKDAVHECLGSGAAVWAILLASPPRRAGPVVSQRYAMRGPLWAGACGFGSGPVAVDTRAVPQSERNALGDGRGVALKRASDRDCGAGSRYRAH